MKIGCITSDGKSVEQVDMSVVKETVYELEIVVVNHPRHYPKYKVSPQTIAFADTQKEAEELIPAALESKKWKAEDIFCFYILILSTAGQNICHHGCILMMVIYWINDCSLHSGLKENSMDVLKKKCGLSGVI